MYRIYQMMNLQKFKKTIKEKRDNMQYIYNPQSSQSEQFQVVMQWHNDQQQ